MGHTRPHDWPDDPSGPTRRRHPGPPGGTGLSAYIAGLPKAELHVHHVGSASPRIVADLAARHPGSPVPTDPEELARFFTFTDFAHFIDVYLAVVDLITTPEDVRLLTYEVAQELAAQQVRYAELTMTPYTSVVRGIPIEAYTEAIEDARVAAERDLGIVLRWIYDIPGEVGLASADATVDVCRRPRPRRRWSASASAARRSASRGRRSRRTSSAPGPPGCTASPTRVRRRDRETVWDALTHLGAERIGHGTSAVRDPRLLEHLAEHRIPLEVCPTSNVATRAVERIEDHPIVAMRDAGVVVTVNSDDPPMFGTTLTREYAVAAALLGLDAAGVTDLARAAVDASFAPDEVRARLHREITAYAAGGPGS